MSTRKIIALLFAMIAIVLGIVFFNKVTFPTGLDGYFKQSYYNQFGPLAICVELLVAGIYLFLKNPKTNFTLALFGFTALLDPLFNLIGLFTSAVPLYATIILSCCAVLSLFMAFSNTFDLRRISFLGAFSSFILGSIIELFFNYL